MDRLDLRILDALQRDGTLTQEELAEKVGSTPSTSLRRATRLKKEGFLPRCVYLADARKLERGVRTIMSISTSSSAGTEFDALMERLVSEPAIDQAYGTTGEVDVMILANFADMEEFRSLTKRLFDGNPIIVKYTTFFAVDRFKDSTAIPTDALEQKLGL